MSQLSCHHLWFRPVSFGWCSVKYKLCDFAMSSLFVIIVGAEQSLSGCSSAKCNLGCVCNVAFLFYFSNFGVVQKYVFMDCTVPDTSCIMLVVSSH